MSKKQKESGLEKIFLFLLALSLIVVIDWGFLRGEITNYQSFCVDGSYLDHGYGKCSSGKEFALNPSSYKPNKKSQTVISWTKMDFDKVGLDTLKDCTVLSRIDWECSFNDKSATFGFSNGDYWSTAKYEDTKSISRLRYIFLRIFPQL